MPSAKVYIQLFIDRYILKKNPLEDFAHKTIILGGKFKQSIISGSSKSKKKYQLSMCFVIKMRESRIRVQFWLKQLFLQVV